MCQYRGRASPRRDGLGPVDAITRAGDRATAEAGALADQNADSDAPTAPPMKVSIAPPTISGSPSSGLALKK